MSTYCTTTEAATYFSGRLHADSWVSANECDKTKALVMATRIIDRQPVKGVKAAYNQGNQFPRYPDKEVPQAVKDATCEEALALLERGNGQRRKLQAEGVTSFSVGGLSETYLQGIRGGGLLSQEARELLRPWLLTAVRIT